MSQKYPDIRWIFSHSGGTLPFLTQRFIQQQKVQKHPHLPDGPIPEFQKLYYELAQGNTKAQLSALFEMVKQFADVVGFQIAGVEQQNLFRLVTDDLRGKLFGICE